MIKLEHFAEIWDRYEYFIFDSDGTLLEMLKPLGDSMQILQSLRAAHKRVYVYSNNSKRSPEEIAERYQKNGQTLVPGKEINTSATMTATYLRQFPDVKNVYLLGTPQFKKILEDEGLNIVHCGDDHKQPVTPELFGSFRTEDVDAVVVGGDDDLDYYKIAFASLCIQNGARLIVADNDPTFRFQGYNFPSSAYCSIPLEIATGKKGTLVGKPSPIGLSLIMARDAIPSADKQKFVMIGDSLSADIRFGVDAGIDTVLLMSGVTSAAELAASEFKPKFVMDSLTI